MSPDRINALIFHGRQEGEAHKDLVARLRKLAEQDQNVVAGSIEIGNYEPPTDAIRADFPFGRYPDLKFIYRQTQVVIEAQLATISLYGINGRRSFYDRLGIPLLWVMPHFDPTPPLRASMKDVIADQRGVLFSVDPTVENLSSADGRFRLRAWSFEFIGKEHKWNQSIIDFDEAIEAARPRAWPDDFKRRWREAYDGKSYSDGGTPDPYVFLNEVAIRAGLAPLRPNDEAGCLLRLIRLLISLEAGRALGSLDPNVLSLANSFERYGGYRATTLIKRALERWQPAFLSKRSMINAFDRADRELAASEERPWGQQSPIGKMLEVLFPEWRLSV